jgi:hypothetical protein
MRRRNGNAGFSAAFFDICRSEPKFEILANRRIARRRLCYIPVWLCLEQLEVGSMPGSLPDPADEDEAVTLLLAVLIVFLLGISAPHFLAIR